MSGATVPDFTAADRTTLADIKGYIDTEVAAIKAKTDLIPATFPLTGHRIKTSPTTGIITYPDGSSGAAPDDGTPAWTYGSWTQIVASTGFEGYILGVSFRAATSREVELQIGVGGAGSEVGLVTVGATEFSSTDNIAYIFMLPIPVRVPNATRLACRIRSSGTDASTSAVKVMYARASDVEGF